MMAVEVSGITAAQARVAQLNSMFGQSNMPAPTTGTAFSTSMDNALEAIKKPANTATALPITGSAEIDAKNRAAATVERPFIYNPSAREAALKSDAKDVFAKAAAAARGETPTTGAVTDTPVNMDGSTKADKLIATAKKYLGIPYKWGGTNPNVGLDCSGLVQLVYKQHGIKLPRVAADQQRIGTKIDSIKDARPGDLVYFGDPAHHVGIYVGNGKMLHAPHTGDVVKISKLHKDLSTIRRVLPNDAWTPPVTTLKAARTETLAAPRSVAGVLAQAPAAYQKLFLAAEDKYGVSADLLAAVAKQESSFNPTVVSHAGARGLMQLMPGTARALGVTDPFDPAQAVDGAARLLRDHLKTFKTVELALAAYNAGPGAVRKYHGIPPYAETQNYVRRITANLKGSRA
ncbi:Gamma-D-glutamyl-L-lysine endopeptidase [Dermatophilus congolensis]|uniref:Gamma-D-glutamyl-L-lysine endopeptidase n=2 Tax=Dermatophilus congolensis TaxID=1863 RepID=A0AA46H0W3_9MICO|nr:Gamma-D-glutamyl-L-lysine endopeptidase [Dermatophilus congolensis]